MASASTRNAPGAGHHGSPPASDQASGLLDRIVSFVRATTVFGPTELSAELSVELAAESAHAPETIDSFDALALETLRFQAERVEPYRRLLHSRSRGRGIATLSHWSQWPAVPTITFKTAALLAAPAREVFRSSGTTRGAERRSVHHHAFPDLYRLVVERSFPPACLLGLPPRPDMLSLVPPQSLAPDSSLSFMVDHVLRMFGGRGSACAIGSCGLEGEPARRWLRAAAAAGVPVLVLATALALDDLLRVLEEAGERVALPPGSALFETGGFKGRHRETSRDDLLARTTDRLAVPPQRVVREYGMTELTSQAYTRVLAGGDPDLFQVPSWMRAQVVDPGTLEEVPPGAVGMLRLFDLGNVGSVAFVLTEDLACAQPGGGFRLVGRAAGAELRGCSLAAEELASNMVAQPPQTGDTGP
ncbi:MAG TPA: hypothetical protein VNB06_00780 [Thermoanaerobaculia bacterium]|nr:hypothetical protein [Thermoanaerobaculia bacterium]